MARLISKLGAGRWSALALSGSVPLLAMRAPLPQKLKEVQSAATRGESCEQTQEKQRWETTGEKALRRPSRTMITSAESFFRLVLQHRGVHAEASADLEKRPLLVIPWIDSEIRKLGSSLNASFRSQQETWSSPELTKTGREEMRKRDYRLFAEALLEAWVNSGEESFFESFCEWAWTAICNSKPQSRYSRYESPYKVDEVELFLEEFLGGKEFELSITVVVGGFCGSKLIAPVFKAFTEKVAAEQDPNLDLEKLTRLDRFLKHLLFCEDPKGWKEDLNYPEWMMSGGFNVDRSRDKRQARLQKEFGKAYEEFQKAVEQTQIMKEKEEEGKRYRENFFKRAPGGGK
jgi:hypothetical protein